MFNPELRIMFTQEADNGHLPFADQHIVAAVAVCAINALCFVSLGWIVYNILLLCSDVTKYLLTFLLNNLSPGNELTELLLIVISFSAAGFMFYTMKCLADLLDNGFLKLKNEIQNKNNRIKELEDELQKKNGLIIRLQENSTANLEDIHMQIINEIDAAKIESWYTGKMLE